MLKRGPKPKEVVKIKWSSNFAYAIGLLATDGYLSKDGLLVDLTSKDVEQLENYSKCLGIKSKIGSKHNGRGDESFRIQLKNRLFYDFLLSIGLTPRKSLTLGKLIIPDKYIFDFIRGCFDGDGSSYSYWDPRWKSSFMFYIGFSSASKKFVDWIRLEIKNKIGINGHITKTERKNGCYQVKYAKNEALELIKKMYYTPNVVCLSRKRKKINMMLKVDREQQKNYV